MSSELAQITRLEKALAEAKTIPELVNVGTQAEAIAHAARRFKAERIVVLQAVWILVEAYERIGDAVGPPPGRGPGPGRGKKRVPEPSFLSDDEVWGPIEDKQARKDITKKGRGVRYRAQKPVKKAYWAWVRKTDTIDPTLKDILILSRCPEDVQAEAITELQTGKADTLMEAIRNVKRRRIVEDEATVPEGQYRCLIVDPPWPMAGDTSGTIGLEDRSPADHLDYTPMTIDQIKAYPIPELSHDDCHCYLWTTQRFLPVALTILEHWGFQYMFLMVWHKSGGMQPFDLPQFNCEFVVYGRKGALPFIDTTDFRTCFTGKRREHSRKPVEFYDLVQRVSTGPRLDVFTREEIEGFSGGGMQKDRFDTPK